MTLTEGLLGALALVLVAMVLAQARTIRRLRDRLAKRVLAAADQPWSDPTHDVMGDLRAAIHTDDRVPPGALMVVPAPPPDSQFVRVFGEGAVLDAAVDAGLDRGPYPLHHTRTTDRPATPRRPR